MGFNFAGNNKKGSTLKWDISELGKDEVTWYKLREMVQIPSRYIDTFKELPKEAIDEMKEKGVEINNFSISNFRGHDTVFFDFVNNED